MFEPPHMHTTMLFIPQHTDPPAISDTIDLQRPLTQTIIDEVIWLNRLTAISARCGATSRPKRNCTRPD